MLLGCATGILPVRPRASCPVSHFGTDEFGESDARLEAWGTHGQDARGTVPVEFRDMKVLVADKFEKSGLDGLAALGCEVLSEPDLKDEALNARLKETMAPVLIVRSTKVTREMIDDSGLKLIIRAGAGYNTIDVVAATANGVTVSNCPGKNAQAVAELAMGLMIAIDRRIADNVAELRAGRWNKKEFSKSKGLWDSTIGLIGLGHIGHDMIHRARAFGMKVEAYSPHTRPSEAQQMGIELAPTITELARMCDVISIHCALNDATRGLCDEAFFAAMKPGAILINTSRAEVIDQAAMLKAIEEKGIRVGLDVFEGEPTEGTGSYDGPLRNNPNVYCTHHIGASTDQAQEAVASETVRIVREYMEGNPPPNAVNQV